MWIKWTIWQRMWEEWSFFIYWMCFCLGGLGCHFELCIAFVLFIKMSPQEQLKINVTKWISNSFGKGDKKNHVACILPDFSRICLRNHSLQSWGQEMPLFDFSYCKKKKKKKNWRFCREQWKFMRWIYVGQVGKYLVSGVKEKLPPDTC